MNVLFAVYLCWLPAALAVELEPNDTTATATPAPFSLIFDGVLPGLVSGNGEQGDLDVDIFAIVVEPDWPVPVTFAALAVSDPPADLMLRLFDASGVEIASNDDGNPFQPKIPAIYTLLLSPGTYYLGVSSTQNPLYKPDQTGSGRTGPGGNYDLFLSGSAAPHTPSLLEPNDSASTASHEGSGSFTVNEFIGDNAFGRLDVDVFQLSLPVPSRLDVLAVSADGIFDPVVRVRSCADPLPAPTVMDRCNLGSADDRPDGSTDAALSTAMFYPGDVFIMVSGSGNRGFDPAVAGSGEPGSVGAYSLSVVVTPLNPNGPDEPNDSLSTTTQTPILIEGRPDSFSMDGYLGDGPYATLRGDRDFYEVRIAEQSRLISVEVFGSDPDQLLIPLLVAYDQRGKILALADGSISGGKASLTLPAGCVATDLGDQHNLILMVMGVKQRPPNDPFDPIEDYSSEVIAEPRVTDGPGSTGPYRLTVRTEPSQQNCSPEPNWSFATATPAPIENEFYFCGGAYMGDTDCDIEFSDLDAWAVDLERPAEMRVEAWACLGSGSPSDLQVAILDHVGALIAESEIDYLYYEPVIVSAHVDEPGRYYVAVANNCGTTLDQHFNQACPNCGSDPGLYDIAILLLPARASAESNENEIAPAQSVSGVQSNDLFATQLSDSSAIVRLDPGTGAVLDELPLPEPHTGGLGGLAIDADNIFYLGEGRFPTLHRLNQETGDVLDYYFTWFGSGYFTDAAMLGNELCLLDHRRREIHVIDPLTPSYLRSISLGSVPGITIGGGLAALSAPNRLFVADAFNSNAIYEIYPPTGELIATIAAMDNRPTALAGTKGNLYLGDFRTQTLEVVDRTGVSVGGFALNAPVGMLAGFSPAPAFHDFDRDGDVDLRDVLAFQRCFGQSAVSFPCILADSNGDGLINLTDTIDFSASTTGP